MKHIEQALGSLFKKSNDNQFWKAHLLQNWPAVVGSLASKMMIHKIYEDSITLGVYELCWMQELYILSPMIQKNINEFLGVQQIKTVRFRAAFHKTREEKKEPAIEQEKIKKLTAQEEASIKSIKDPDLAHSLKLLLEKCHH
jgi:hypothetical protein